MGKFDCGELKNSEEENQYNEFFKKRGAELGLEEKYALGIEDKPWYGKLLQGMYDKYIDTETPITQKEFQKAIKKYVKGASDQSRAILVLNIKSLLSNNALLREAFWQDINYESAYGVPNEILGKKPFETVKKIIKDPISGKDKTYTVPVIADLPLSVLDKLYSQMYSWATAGLIDEKGNKIPGSLELAPGIFGNIQLGLLTPRSIEKRENTGSIRKARISTERYADNAQHRALEFWNDRVVGEEQIRGFRYWVSQLAGLASYGKTQTDENTIFYLSQYYPEGRIVIDEDTGKVYQYKEKVFKGGYNEDGSSILEWDGLQPLLNPAPMVWDDEVLSEGDQLILDPTPPSPGEVSALQKFKNINREMQKLYHEFGLAQKGVLESQGVRYSRVAALIKDGLIPKEFVELLTQHIHSDVSIGGFNSLEMKVQGTYSPVMFSPHMLPIMFDRAKDETESKKNLLEASLAGAKLSPAERKVTQRKIWKLDNSLTYINETRDHMDDMYDDPQSEQKILTRQYIKNFKPISGMFDTRQRMVGRNIPNDYLEAVGKTLERNDVTLDILEALATAQTDGVRDYIINLYKTTFHYPDMKSTFLGLPIDMVTIPGLFGKMGIPITSHGASRVLKSIGSYQIFNLLHGPVTGLRNATAMFNKIHDMSLSRLMDSVSEYNGPDKDFWRNEVENAGVVNFQRYLEGFVVRSLRPEERILAKKHIDHLYSLVKDAKKNPNKGKAYYERYAKRLRRAKFDYNIESRLNAMAQWAVTHNVRDSDLKQSALKKSWKTVLGFYKHVPSIQGTEGFVRTLSYIMGVKTAVKKGLASSYTDPAARVYGIEYTYLSDHGLSPQDLGYDFRGALGNLNTKLKYWQTQRNGREWRIGVDAFNAAGDYTYDDNGKKHDAKSIKKLYRMFSGLITVPGGRNAKILREVNPYQAAFRSLIWKQMTATLLIDYVIFAPGTSLASKMLKGAFFRSNTLKAGSGLSSDLFSMISAVGHLMFLVAMGSATEDDIDDRFWVKFLRNGHLGVLPTSIISMIAAMTRDYDRQSETYRQDWDGKHGPNAITPFIPGGNTTRTFIEQYNRIKK